MKQFEFKVIAGRLKGKRIFAPDLGVTRPPLSRLRRSIFDFLNPYLDSTDYLDLFSGTGSYLFEAVSRGVKSATGVEVESRLAESINLQAQKLGVEHELRCLHDDVFKAIPGFDKSGRTFGIIMVAPPQYKRLVDETLRCICSHPILQPDGIIICQHDSSETSRIDFCGFETVQQRKYGNTTFTILRNH